MYATRRTSAVSAILVSWNPERPHKFSYRPYRGRRYCATYGFSQEFSYQPCGDRNNFSTMSVDICLIGRRYFPKQTIIIASTHLTGALDMLL
jgi:hypothetical protein